MLSGLGVPDISGRVGKPFFFTSELDFQRSRRERVLDRGRAARGQQGRHPDEIQGPPNKLFGDPPYISIPMTITVADDRNSIRSK